MSISYAQFIDTRNLYIQKMNKGRVGNIATTIPKHHAGDSYLFITLIRVRSSASGLSRNLAVLGAQFVLVHDFVTCQKNKSPLPYMHLS